MSEFQVGPGTFVTISYRVLDAEGEAVGPAEVLGFVFGTGELFPRVEQALEARLAGDVLEVSLPPEHAYGRRKEEAVLTVDRCDFPPGVSPGDRFEVENADGGVLVLHVLDVAESTVVVDTNHPLADQQVTAQVEVLEVRPASSEEIEAAEAAVQEDRAFFEAEIPQVPVAHLLRPRAGS